MSYPGPWLPYDPPAPAPARVRRGVVVLLGVVTAVLLLTAGAFATLYVLASGDRDAAEDLLAQRRTQLVGLTERAEATEDERERAEQRTSDLETTRTDLAACVDAVEHYLWDELTAAELHAAFDRMSTECW